MNLKLPPEGARDPPHSKRVHVRVPSAEKRPELHSVDLHGLRRGDATADALARNGALHRTSSARMQAALPSSVEHNSVGYGRSSVTRRNKPSASPLSDAAPRVIDRTHLVSTARARSTPTAAASAFIVCGSPVVPSSTAALAHPQSNTAPRPISYHHQNPASHSPPLPPPPPLFIVPFKLRANPPSTPQRRVLPLHSISGWQRLSKTRAASPPPLPSAAHSPPGRHALPTMPQVADARDGASGVHSVVYISMFRDGDASVASTPRWNNHDGHQGQPEAAGAVRLHGWRRGDSEAYRSPPMDVCNLRPRSEAGAKGGGWMSVAFASAPQGSQLPPAARFVARDHVTDAVLPAAAATGTLPTARVVSLQGCPASPSASTGSGTASDSALPLGVSRMIARASAQCSRGIKAPWSRSTLADCQKERDGDVDCLVRVCVTRALPPPSPILHLPSIPQ